MIEPVGPEKDTHLCGDFCFPKNASGKQAGGSSAGGRNPTKHGRSVPYAGYCRRKKKESIGMDIQKIKGLICPRWSLDRPEAFGGGFLNRFGLRPLRLGCLHLRSERG